LGAGCNSGGYGFVEGRLKEDGMRAVDILRNAEEAVHRR
jgi:hypothetical protein